MKKEQGFSLIELLIVVAIIAIIAAIAVPSMLTARMAANEAGAIQGCRTIGSAEMAYAAVNNQTFADLTDLVTDNFLDGRFTAAGGFNGYEYAAGTVTNGTPLTLQLTVSWLVRVLLGAPGGIHMVSAPTRLCATWVRALV